MHPKILLTALAALLPLTTASFVLSSQQLLAIVPKSSSCPSTGQYSDECVTATIATGPINKSFSTYSISTPGEAAALIATMAYESGSFEYCIHHFPGPVPGQGTRNMQGYTFNLQYAQSISALSGVLAGAEATGPDAVLQLLIENADYDFGSAAWFYTSQCGASVKSGLQAGTQAGWEAYVGCIGAEFSDDRTALWTTAMQVLGAKTRR